ncbi:hypothetical protein [Bacillus toyonensis]|nr:hypothetical protein [Bacillus toyonensis]
MTNVKVYFKNGTVTEVTVSSFEELGNLYVINEVRRIEILN